ncbi:hypothetical protein GCM10010973_08950 [Cribrihabitans marinus]|nr:hypothetical protein GCM10010973_08950 [Cribrihabitans marinus]
MEIDMAIHDAKLVSDAEMSSTMAKLDKIERMSKQPAKPFRRKAALKAAAKARRVTGAKPVTPAAPRIQLPAALPEPWLRLEEIALEAPGGKTASLPLVNRFRGAPATRAFDVLRTRLLQTLKARGWRRVAVAAPTRGCGATFTAVNLALSLARVPDSRTVLMDLNLREPGVAKALGRAPSGDMRGFLKGNLRVTDHLLRCGQSLALGLSDRPAVDAAELLQAPVCAGVLDAMILDMNPDVVLYDLPAMLAHDDLSGFLPQIDGVLLVADGTRTTAAHIRACERVLGEDVPLLGVALNRARGSDNEAFAV